MPDRSSTAAVRVLKRFDDWHWWCSECMGGNWTARWTDALAAARKHIESCHG